MFIEVLSPAGSYDNLVAAIRAGADAIYVGGKKFSARANASNFTQEELLDAIDYVHLHGKRIYLTINTLLKEQEMGLELYEYVKPLYEKGLDAVIVQDLGVLQFIRTYFPGIQIHASTQMTITGTKGVKFLEELGVDRVVTARELSLNELKDISINTNVEIESFVHGALCYSYSGQCLYSSMIGNRSGNRGQCAQPCRLPYKLSAEQGKYLMSLKDICALDIIPDIVESGVTSLKIEGRMKKKEYVYLVTAMYRKYVDLYLEYGRKNYKVDQADLDMLKDIFNRGDFHQGYYNLTNGQSMITFDKPNHSGVPVAVVEKQERNIVTIKTLKDVNKGDVLEVQRGGDDYTIGSDYKKGMRITLNLRKGVHLKKNHILHRTRNNALIEEVLLKSESKIKNKVNMHITLKKGELSSLQIQFNDLISIVFGEIVTPAINAPAKIESIQKQLQKTGDTVFEVIKVKIEMDEDIFIANKQLNSLRRAGIKQLEDDLLEQYKRKIYKTYIKPSFQLGECKYTISAFVETWEQLEAITQENIINRIYIDWSMLTQSENRTALQMLLNSSRQNAEIIYAMPHIIRQKDISMLRATLEGFVESSFDGVMIRNLESLELLREIGYRKTIVTDHNLYVFNNETSRFWKSQGIERQTLPYELTKKELNQLELDDKILNIYGNIPTMISAQCIKKSTGKCDKANGVIEVRDRKGQQIWAKNYCEYCYNVIHSTEPLCLLEETDEIRKLSVKEYRCNFTLESESEVKSVLRKVNAIFHLDKIAPKVENIGSYKGHFYNEIR